MSGTSARPPESEDGFVAGEISTATVRLLHEYTGRGPTKARTTIGRDLIVVVLADAMTRVERKLATDGKADAVLNLRREFQRTMRGDLIDAVENASGRRVVAFMSDNHFDPDMAAEVFVLAPQGDAD